MQHAKLPSSISCRFWGNITIEVAYIYDKHRLQFLWLHLEYELNEVNYIHKKHLVEDNIVINSNKQLVNNTTTSPCSNHLTIADLSYTCNYICNQNPYVDLHVAPHMTSSWHHIYTIHLTYWYSVLYNNTTVLYSIYRTNY